MLRLYARIVGLILFSLGIVGLAGVVGVSTASSFYHACVGAFFAYLGFCQQDTLVVRRVVGGLGLMLLLVKGVTTAVPLLWGSDILLGPIEVTCFVVGVLSVVVARYTGDDSAAERT